MPTPSPGIEKLLQVMAKLRDPNGGCPWDLAQDFKSITKYTIEETYEVVETIEQGDMKGLREELGDLLLQIVFYAQMAREQSLFDFNDIAQTIADKMIERHPHVFAKTATADTPDNVLNIWEKNKAAKRATSGALDGVITALPAMARALKLQQRAARVGFDWKDPKDILDKLDEETAEVKEAIHTGEAEKIEDEIGDMMFVLVNLARRMEIDPEGALRAANRKFERRFRAMEGLLASEKMEDKNLEALEELWQQVKRAEK